MIEFFLYGYTFTYDGVKFSGDNNSLVSFFNQFVDLSIGYFPIGHNLYIILSAIYPDEDFDFTNVDRTKFFYLISFPDTNDMPENVIL